eukprot:5596699-Pleurochrysis_carterae.AAC.1
MLFDVTRHSRKPLRPVICTCRGRRHPWMLRHWHRCYAMHAGRLLEATAPARMMGQDTTDSATPLLYAHVSQERRDSIIIIIRGMSLHVSNLDVKYVTTPNQIRVFSH